ncbi:SPOR domain-containing protein [Rugosimonospora africana]|uniref:SPOR domain-containing protein n=1 Tax=Rugosimonospora africana TaxID=556532 RepID=A0A8J3QUQ6_9ACTN|nr:SPOR domain-containing protein [Rugosimonospora africana]GIH16372.1 hypothetical protein Raf01_45440 [Rugosimonospora africana]
MEPLSDAAMRDAETPDPVWTVWRQDDNGNQYEVSRHDSRADAESAAATLEARGHKQTYWVARRSRRHSTK